MKDFEGKKCTLIILRDRVKLYFTATVLAVSGRHITFLDKFGKHYTFRLSEVIEIQEVLNNGKK